MMMYRWRGESSPQGVIFLGSIVKQNDNATTRSRRYVLHVSDLTEFYKWLEVKVYVTHCTKIISISTSQGRDFSYQHIIS
jgi:hypothetical protein